MVQKSCSAKTKKNESTLKDNSIHVCQRDKISKELFIRTRSDLTDIQKQIIDAALDKNVKAIILDGAPGVGKSYISIFSGLQLLNEKKMGQMIYLRSLIQAKDGETGFLAGSLEDKTYYYNQPLYQALEEILPKNDVDYLIKDQRVIAYPTSMLRSYNFHNSVIVAEECFPSNTYVMTENGPKQISYLIKLLKSRRAPKVWSFNEDLKKFELDEIICIKNKGIKKTIKISCGSKKIECTPNHKFLTLGGWKEADKLSIGSILICNNSKSNKTTKILNSDQEQIFLGSFLGDGSINRLGNRKYRICVIHGAQQKEYCEWKAKLLDVPIQYVTKNGISQKPAFRFAGKTHVFENEFPLGIKTTCPNWILEKIDIRGIAVWYMDDGSINKTKNQIKIYTCSFDLETQEKFVHLFKSKFNINCKIKFEIKEGKDAYMHLNFNAENTRKFLDLVGPYIHENLFYKSNGLNCQHYQWNNNFLEYTQSVVTNIEKINDEKEVYDLEIKNNHNFVVSNSRNKSNTGFVVHNCQNMSWESLFTIATRAGMYSKLFVIGDSISQNDLGSKSGFNKFVDIFSDKESEEFGFRYFKMGSECIVRSPFVKFVVQKVERYHALKDTNEYKTKNKKI